MIHPSSHSVPFFFEDYYTAVPPCKDVEERRRIALLLAEIIHTSTRYLVTNTGTTNIPSEFDFLSSILKNECDQHDEDYSACPFCSQ